MSKNISVLKKARSYAFWRKEWFWGVLFILPLTVGLLLFSFYPVFSSFYMSLTEWNGMTQSAFVGISNFTQLVGDSTFWRECTNTGYYAIASVPISLLLSIILANALTKINFLGKFYGIVYFLPNITMPVASAAVWRWLFNSKFGLINQVLGYIGISGPQWLGDPRYIMPAVIIVTIWGSLGYNMILLQAGIKNIPKTYYEASEIDGAKGFRQFVSITIPMLSPTVFFLFVTSTMNALKAFDIVYMFSGASSTASGPLMDATRTIVYGIYQQGFTFLRMGYASAEAVLLFIIIMIITFFQFLMQKRWVHYE